MIIQIVRFTTTLSEEQVMAVANERADQFRALPGLIQKYYVKLAGENEYGGIYHWEDAKSMAAYRNSDLASSIPAAYEINGAPKVEIINTLFELRS